MLNERDNLIDKICKMECWTNIDWTVKFDYQIVLDTEQSDPYSSNYIAFKIVYSLARLVVDVMWNGFEFKCLMSIFTHTE